MSSSNTFTRVIRDWSEIFMQRSMRDFKRFMNLTGLSFSQINILMRLVHGQPIGVSEIGENPVDRRMKRLALTQGGRDLIEKSIEARSNWVEDLTDALTPAQQEMIISALILLTDAARKNIQQSVAISPVNLPNPGKIPPI
jgi:DNA-binding MarR family transcriptional regulator